VFMRGFGANGLPIAFASATALFIGVFALYQQRGSTPAP